MLDGIITAQVGGRSGVLIDRDGQQVAAFKDMDFMVELCRQFRDYQRQESAANRLADACRNSGDESVQAALAEFNRVKGE